MEHEELWYEMSSPPIYWPCAAHHRTRVSLSTTHTVDPPWPKERRSGVLCCNTLMSHECVGRCTDNTPTYEFVQTALSRHIASASVHPRITRAHRLRNRAASQ